MTVEEGYKFFDKIPAIKQKLQTLMDVGLDYIKIGQSATTLSGGEAQRIKLSKELSKRSQEKHYIFLMSQQLVFILMMLKNYLKFFIHLLMKVIL